MTGSRTRTEDDAVRWFQRDSFDVYAYLGQLQTERELGHARQELTALNEFCQREVRGGGVAAAAPYRSTLP
jgi:hypothetical protein